MANIITEYETLSYRKFVSVSYRIIACCRSHDEALPELMMARSVLVDTSLNGLRDIYGYIRLVPI